MKDGLIDEYDGDCPGLSIPIDTAYTYFISSIWKNGTRYAPGNLKITTAYPLANISIQTADGTSFNQTTTVSQGTPIEVNTEILQSQDVNSVQNDEGLIIVSDYPINVFYDIGNGFNLIKQGWKSVRARFWIELEGCFILETPTGVQRFGVRTGAGRFWLHTHCHICEGPALLL